MTPIFNFLIEIQNLIFFYYWNQSKPNIIILTCIINKCDCKAGTNL